MKDLIDSDTAFLREMAQDLKESYTLEQATMELIAFWPANKKPFFKGKKTKYHVNSFQ